MAPTRPSDCANSSGPRSRPLSGAPTTPVAPVTDRVLEEARLQKDRELKGALSQEQREALETITGPGGVVILVGQAGTGKGVVLSAATDAWQKEGYEVIGTAVPGATAMRLQADTKSDQGVTADSLITSFEHGHLEPRSQHRDRARRGRDARQRATIQARQARGAARRQARPCR